MYLYKWIKESYSEGTENKGRETQRKNISREDFSI